MSSERTSEGSYSDSSGSDEASPGRSNKPKVKSQIQIVSSVASRNDDLEQKNEKEETPYDSLDHEAERSAEMTGSRSNSHSPRRRKSSSHSPASRNRKHDKKRQSKSPSSDTRNNRDKPLKHEPSNKKSDKFGEQAKAMLTTKTGGAYIPPAKLRLMQQQITDKASEQFQRLAWEALKKSINGLVNKVNSPNIGIIVRELFAENIVRGRGLLCLSIMQVWSLENDVLLMLH